MIIIDDESPTLESKTTAAAAVAGSSSAATTVPRDYLELVVSVLWFVFALMLYISVIWR